MISLARPQRSGVDRLLARGCTLRGSPGWTLRERMFYPGSTTGGGLGTYSLHPDGPARGADLFVLHPGRPAWGWAHPTAPVVQLLRRVTWVRS